MPSSTNAGESTEKEVEISVSPSLTLAGSLLEPNTSSKNNNKLLVVFVAGSGPIDRDENMPMQKLNVFNAMAESLVNDAGVASFRYDNRGTGKSGGKFEPTGLYDLLQDLIAVMDHILQTEQDGRYADYTLVFVGHSEGTLLSAMASQKRPDAVDSIVLLCPFVTPLEQILVDQGASVEKTIEEEPGCTGSCTRAIIKLFGLQPSKIQAGLIEKIKASSDPTISFMFKKVPALWFS